MLKNLGKKLAVISAAVVGVVSAAVPTFAETVQPYVVTAADLSGLQTTINSSITVLVPIGIGVMATMVGIGLIPRIIYRFI